MSNYIVQEISASLTRYATEVFGLIGNGNAHLINELINAGCNYTALRHEAGAVAAADAYTRVSKQLAIATTTYGAGFTNSLTALAEAVKARTPMLVVVGDEPEGGSRGIDVDQEMLTVALGTRNYRLKEGNIAKIIDRAVKFALRVRKPVVIGIPYNLTRDDLPAKVTLAASGSQDLSLDSPGLIEAMSLAVLGEPEKTKPQTVPITTSEGIDPRAVDIKRALEKLTSAKKPLVLAGRGAWLAESSEELSEIAMLLGALTTSTALARGIFHEQQFDLGVAGGFSAEGAAEKIKIADAVLVVGASLNEFTMRFGDLLGAKTQVVRVDIEAVQRPEGISAENYFLLQADAKRALLNILQELRETEFKKSAWRDEHLAESLEHSSLDKDSQLPELTNDGRLDPRVIAEKLAKLFPSDIYITQDGGHFIAWPNMFWPVSSPERMTMVGTAYQSIGLGIASAVGVAIAKPEATVILSMGDGGGLMGISDLESAIRVSKSLIIVVWNDAAYGAEVHLYGELGLGKDPMLIPEVNFVSLAKSFGADGTSVRSHADLAAFEKWVEAGASGTFVLDLKISRQVVAPYQKEILRQNSVAG